MTETKFPLNEDYAGLMKELREDVLQFNLKDTAYESIAKDAADALEAVLAERDALKAERDALLARLAPVDDKELGERVVNEIRKQLPASGVMYIHIANAARAVVAAIRPHIEAAERERCAKAVEKVAERINVAHHERPEWEDGYLQGVYDAAAAIRSGK